MGRAMSNSFDHVTTSQVAHAIAPAGIISPFVGYFLSFLGAMPVIIGSGAGLAAMFYYIIMSLQSPDVRAWLNRRREAKRLRKVARLQYRQSILVGELKQLGMLTHAEVNITEGHSTTNIEVTQPPAAQSKS